jgi:hypothetical protein
MRVMSGDYLLNQPMRTIEDLLDVVRTENGLCDRLADATPGDTIVYHIGLLARDRDKIVTMLMPERRDELEIVARRAWQMAEAGLVHLLQRRVADECFAYLVIVRPRPRNARSVLAMAVADLLQREAA